MHISCTGCREHKEWQISENPLLTRWAENINPDSPWPEYPRPGMIRDKWINLNGLWDYTITERGARPEVWQGKILVPYPVESALSGVRRRVSENETIWYRKLVKLPGEWSGKRIILNLEASDWETMLSRTLCGLVLRTVLPFSLS